MFLDTEKGHAHLELKLKKMSIIWNSKILSFKVYFIILSRILINSKTKLAQYKEINAPNLMDSIMLVNFELHHIPDENLKCGS